MYKESAYPHMHGDEWTAHTEESSFGAASRKHLLKQKQSIVPDVYSLC